MKMYVDTLINIGQASWLGSVESSDRYNDLIEQGYEPSVARNRVYFENGLQVTLTYSSMALIGENCAGYGASISISTFLLATKGKGLPLIGWVGLGGVIGGTLACGATLDTINKNVAQRIANGIFTSNTYTNEKIELEPYSEIAKNEIEEALNSNDTISFPRPNNTDTWKANWQQEFENSTNAFSSQFESAEEAIHIVPRSQNWDPLILDLDGDGIETTTRENGIYFDHEVNGFAENSAWVGADDGLLVRDLNSNGVIDSGRELFGNNTLLLVA